MRIIFALTLVTTAATAAAQPGAPAERSEPEADAPQPGDSAEADEPPPAALALARALEARLTVWERSDRRVYVWHCRRARVDCRARVVALARLIAESAQRHRVDPFLVAAIALRESGLNPFAEGGAGERGIVQLHPRGVGSRVRFVRSEAYRRRCERRADACQAEVIDAGARHLASAIARCGSAAAGLGAYNTGVCQETGYSRRVLEERESLIRLAKRATSTAPTLVD